MKINVDGYGSTMKNSFSISQPSDYQGSLFRRFTGKEKDSESGYYYFGARYFMPTLSIWNSVDPMADKYPSLSPYNYCAWNPIKLVDNDGMEIADYYDIYGNYIGSDGRKDNIIYLVTDEKEVNQIIDNAADCNVMYTESSTISSKLQLLSHEVRNRILDYLETSHEGIPNNEYGGVVVRQSDGTDNFARYKPGVPYKQGEKGSVSSAIMPEDKNIIVNSNGIPLTRFHSHGIWLNQNPSKQSDGPDNDIGNYLKAPVLLGYAMQMGMVSKKVNFYNATGVMVSLPFNIYRSIGKKE
ncbi:MAG: RHS repeat-associated core domain-containing protein [Bacteroidales bacterium]|nr:RHS repeat-associated core domain-containing protein [Bacteroidales bacterium]